MSSDNKELLVSGIERTKQWFEQAIPEPTDEHKSIQLGCHIEEVAEMLSAVDLHEWAHDIDLLATDLKVGDDSVSNLSINRKELLDSLADQIVTAVGVAHMFGMDISGALEEVNRSNFSKFENGKPVFDDNGKITKGKDYTPPSLKPYI
jgi:predicted HAD superfamily Cof-like phosphohydrolase